MAETVPEPNEAQRTLDIILTTGINVISRLVPGWEPPVLEHPYAVSYSDSGEMMVDIVVGDQIMVKAPSGYWHHGIYVGNKRMLDCNGYKQNVAVVVDFWGEDKERCNITARMYRDFAKGAVGWAKAEYPKGAAIKRSLSARLAIEFADHAKENPFTYNLVLSNCEVFATICRCIRSVHAVECHAALRESLLLLPAPVRVHRPGGFK